MKKRYTLLILCALLAFLAGCGAKNQPPDIDKTGEILERFTSDYSQYDFISTDITEDSVEYNADDGIEESWGQVVGKTETMVITCPYYLKYTNDSGSWNLTQLRLGDAEIEMTVDPVTEDFLETDIGPAILSECCNDNLTLDSIIVDERTMDSSKLEERLRITVNVMEPDANGWFSVEAAYVLGSEQWELKDWNVLDSGAEVIGCSVPQETAQADMLAFYTERFDEDIYDCKYVTHSCDSELNSATFEFQMVQKFGYYSQQKPARLFYDYSLKDGWIAANYTPNAADVYVGTWDVLGEWTYSDSVNNVWVNIISVDENEITYEYEIDCRVPYEGSWSGESTDVVMITSDGERTDSLREVDDEDFALRFPITDSPSTCSLYLYPYKGVTFNGRIWNADDTYILSYSDTDKAAQVLKEEHADWPEETISLYDAPIIYHTPGIELSSIKFDYGNKDTDDVESTEETVHHNVMYYADEDNEGAASNTYNLYGNYETLTGTVFLMQGATPGKSAKVQIFGDGTRLYSFDAKVFTENDYIETFTIDVTNVRELTVELTGETYRQSTFLGSYDAALIGLAELTAYRDSNAEPPASAPASTPTPTPSPAPAASDDPPQASQASPSAANTITQMLLTSVVSDYSTIEFLYDDNNELIQTVETTQYGDTFTADYSYNEANKCVLSKYWSNGMEGSGYTTNEWFFNDNYEIEKLRTVDASDEISYTYYTYNSQGWVIHARHEAALEDWC